MRKLSRFDKDRKDSRHFVEDSKAYCSKIKDPLTENAVSKKTSESQRSVLPSGQSKIAAKVLSPTQTAVQDAESSGKFRELTVFEEIMNEGDIVASWMEEDEDDDGIQL